jgi:hypothetical protein
MMVRVCNSFRNLRGKALRRLWQTLQPASLLLAAAMLEGCANSTASPHEVDAPVYKGVSVGPNDEELKSMLPDDAYQRLFLGHEPDRTTPDGVMIFGRFTDAAITDIQSAVKQRMPDERVATILRMSSGAVEVNTQETRWRGHRFILIGQERAWRVQSAARVH